MKVGAGADEEQDHEEESLKLEDPEHFDQRSLVVFVYCSN